MMISALNSVSKQDIRDEKNSLCHHSESQEHRQKKFDVAINYIDRGFLVGIEERVPELGYIVDVIAKDGDNLVAIEVGHTNKKKLSELDEHFDAVRHIAYKKDGKKIKHTSSSGSKTRITVSLDSEVISRLDQACDGNRSKLINEIMVEWLDEQRP